MASTSDRSKTAGKNPAPMPWILCGPGFKRLSGALLGDDRTGGGFHGHRSDRLSLGHLDVAGYAGMVPPVPTPDTSMSIAPPVSSQISGPVVCSWMARLAGFLNCCNST